MTRVRNFEDVRFGEYLIKTWYYSPYPRLAIADERATSPTPHPVVGNGHNQKRRKLNGDHPKTHHVALEIGSSASKAGLKKERSVQDIYAASMSKAGEGVRGRIWVCDVSPCSRDGQGTVWLSREVMLQVHADQRFLGETHRELFPVIERGV